jgi:hypothetical protein
MWLASTPIVVAQGGEGGIPLRFSEVVHAAEVSVLGPGEYRVRVTGGDPYVVCEPLEAAYNAERLHMFAFEYRCDEDIDFFEMFFGNPFNGDDHLLVRDIPAAPDWRPFAFDLTLPPNGRFDARVRDFRIDFGSGDEAGPVVDVRNLRLRAMTPDEVEVKQEAEAAARREREALLDQIEGSLVAPARIILDSEPLAAVHTYTEAGHTTAVSVLGRDLDLYTLVKEEAEQVPPSVPLAPPKVVGEGADPGNHTLVRVLNEYGICEVQFLAFAPTVRGGVRVATGPLFGESSAVVTAALSEPDVREIRVFSRYGSLLSSFSPPASVGPPYAIAVGRFAPGTVAIAVAPAVTHGRAFTVAVVEANGEPIHEVRVPVSDRVSRTVSLAAAQGEPGADGDRLIVYPAGAPDFYLVTPDRPTPVRVEAGLDPRCTGVFGSGFPGSGYVATLGSGEQSLVQRVGFENGSPEAGEPVDVGRRERLFWFTAVGAFGDVPEGEYTRHSLFAHLRTDFMSPVADDPDFSRTDPEYWAGEGVREQVRARVARYDSDPPTCWEPCFTHRWFYGRAQKWAAVQDPETGLPAYTLVTRDNEVGSYGEFGHTNQFLTGTYAPGVTPIESLYTFPQRVFLHELVQAFRRNPEHFVAVEPNHEMEINAESETTHGDYNPNMIRAFYRYLIGLYGDLDAINRVFGADFSAERFDAPRGLDRGTWDAYDTENPYYMVWMRFLNYVVYRVVAGTYREALLAGFPPEAVKCHQIPDHYAISSLTAFSKPARRITPIDWNLNAGVGYGFTRYGVWYNREFNCVQGPYSSGFDSMLVGEYQSLVPDADLAFRQLQYMRDHGIQFIHCMNWPAGHDRGFNAALRDALAMLVEEDRPRPGVVGGTREVRVVSRADGSRFEVVSLGTAERNTGLIKSVTREGDWEGSVYAVPFRAHVAVAPVLVQDRAQLSAEPIRVGPFPGIGSGSVVSFSFMARSRTRDAAVGLRLFHHGFERPAQRLTAPVGDEWRHVRFLVRIQVETDEVSLELGAGNPGGEAWPSGTVEVRDLVVTHEQEMTAKLKKGVFAGQRHEGGVTFDLLKP